MRKNRKFVLALLLLSMLSACVVFGEKERVNTLSTDIVEPTNTTAAIQREIVTIEPTVEQVSLLDEIQRLGENWHENYVKTGWVRVRHQETVGYDNGLGHQDYYFDNWILLDEQGYQVSAIHLMADLAGKPFQVSVMQDNMWRNITYNTVSPVPPETLPLTLVIDFGFFNEATRLSDSLVKEEIEIDGKPVIVYTITEQYATPMKFSDYNELVSAFVKRAYYDPETGTLLRFEAILVSPTGTSHFHETVQLVDLETGIEPPSEILKYLEQP